MRKVLLYIIMFASLFFATSSLAGAYSLYGNSSMPYDIPCNGAVNCVQYGAKEVQKNVDATTKPFSTYVQDYINYLLTFLTIIAVIYIIWAGFQIMIGEGDTEKLGKAKKTILYVAIGIIIIWLAYAIVIWVINLTTGKVSYAPNAPRYSFSLIESANAATENQAGTFAEYQSSISDMLTKINAERMVNGQVSVSNLTTLKSLLQAASDRLPDKYLTQNRNALTTTLAYIDMAIANPRSTSTINDMGQSVQQYIDAIKIDAITTSGIQANPMSGNSPLTVSFSA